MVFTSYKSPYFTMINNFNSTLSILETIKNYNRKLICIFITSDKVYQNNDKKIDYKETDILREMILIQHQKSLLRWQFMLILLF